MMNLQQFKHQLILLPTFVLCVVVSLTFPQKIFAQIPQEKDSAIDVDALSNQMDQMAAAGAKGFLIWQYSGNLSNGEYFGNDQYSFFQETTKGKAVCNLLKQKSPAFEFVGVNMWDIGAGYSQDVVKHHFSWLKNECGASVIRVFAKAGEVQGMTNVLNSAQETGVKIIIAVGDYSNGGGHVPYAAPPSWYDNNYSAYREFAQQIASAVSHHPALYSLELANEPHCTNAVDADLTISHYTNWGKDVGQILRQHSNNVGYGQMADPNGICDSPIHPSQGFRVSNSIEQITMASAHYYNQLELDASFVAAQISQEIGKKFYIGEANWLTTDTHSTKKLTHNDYLTVPLILKPENYVFEDNLVNKLVWNMVVDQGYEVSCASPELRVSGEAIGKLMDYFSDANHSGPGQILELSGAGDYEVGMHNSVIPMYRDLDKKSLGKTASYEAFFGTLNDDYSGMTQSGENVLHTGVANNLLTLSQQCRLKMDSMRVARDLCNRLQDKDSCVLHSTIPNSEFYLFSTPTQESIGEKSLLNTLESWNGWDPLNEDFGCSQLMSEYSAEYDSLYQVSEADFNSAQQAMLNTSIDLERVYRYAFVVVSPLQNRDERCYGENPEDKFWFLNDRELVGQDNPCMGFAADNQKKRVPIFIGIKIPTLATNDIESLSLKNTASITANTLTTLDLQENKVEILNSRFDLKNYDDESSNSNPREDFLSQVKSKMEIWERADQDELNTLIINCHGIPTCMGAHGAGTELRLALVHIINGSGVTCKGEEFFTGTTTVDKIMGTDNPAPHGSVENAGNIGSPALQNLSPQRIFLDNYFNVQEPSAKSQKWRWNIRLDKKLAQALVNDGNDVISESVLIHMVAPLGAELKYIEGRLASLFASRQLELIVDNNVMVDTEGIIGDVARYFPIQDTHLQFESRAFQHYQHVECNDVIDPITGLSTGAKEDCETAGVKLSDENVGLYIQGAKLGWLIRNIQLAITRYGESLDSTHAYIASCQRIEDLFLGKCDPKYGPGGLPWAGRDWRGDWDSSGCVPINDDSSYCSVSNLEQKLREYIIDTNSTPISDQELTKRATQASIICNAESGGNPNALNDGCISGKTVDYSVGLFQINLLAHNCPEYFSFTWDPPWCSINQPYTKIDVESCAAPLLNPDENIKKAFQISGAGSNWWAWSTARPKHCNICTASRVCEGMPESELEVEGIE